MVMCVDEARHHHVLVRAQHLLGRVAGPQLRVRSHLHHEAVALEDGAVGDDARLAPALNLDHDILPADQRRGHRDPPPGMATPLRERYGRGVYEPVSLTRLKTFTGRLIPLRETSPTGSASTRLSTLLSTFWESRTWPGWASAQRRAARFVTVPMAP